MSEFFEIPVLENDLSMSPLPNPDEISYYVLEKERKIYLDYTISNDTLAIQRMILRWNIEDRDTPANERKPIYIYVIAVVIGFLVWLWKRDWKMSVLFGYLFLILAETVLIRKPFIGVHIRLEPFWSWKQWRVQKNQILTNIVMFIPVGVLAGRMWKWRGLWVAAGLSAGIEVLQLITSRGLCEFDDVMHNMIGAAIGIAVVMIIDSRIKRNRE